MFRNALAYRLTVGFAVLFLGAPIGLAAQLPDAPSTVKMLEVSEAFSAGREAKDDRPGAFNSFSASNRTGFWEDRSFNFVSASAWTPHQIAFNVELVASPQQSLYKPSRQNASPGFSSSIAQEHPIPGSAPVLYHSCPKNICLRTSPMMCCGQASSPFARYLKSPYAVRRTALDNAHLAVHHVIDPFNLLTIVADAGIGIASDSHSAYGPGLEGFAKYSGVSLTEDMTGEFFGTFLIPSLVHQDPSYHREPYVSVKRRLLHAVTQIVWTQSYTGKPMLNYANIFGSIATAAVSNTFVPGPNRQGVANTSKRLALAFAISPSGNLISEFFPDIANRVNLRVVIFQRILNTVSIEESGVP